MRHGKFNVIVLCFILCFIFCSCGKSTKDKINENRLKILESQKLLSENSTVSSDDTLSDDVVEEDLSDVDLTTVSSVSSYVVVPSEINADYVTPSVKFEDNIENTLTTIIKLNNTNDNSSLVGLPISLNYFSSLVQNNTVVSIGYVDSISYNKVSFNESNIYLIDLDIVTSSYTYKYVVYVTLTNDLIDNIDFELLGYS